MANNCRAKEPNSCRVHGNGGALDQLQKTADAAALNHDIKLYMSIRTQMDALTDDAPVSFIAPDRGEFNIENWKDSSGKIMPEAPNDMLINNMYQSARREMPDAGKVAEILRSRGYEEQDLLLAKHFCFGKDDNSSTNAVTARKLSVLTAEIENKHGVRYVPSTKQRLIEKYFNLGTYTYKANRERCKRFVEEYEEFVIANK